MLAARCELVTLMESPMRSKMHAAALWRNSRPCLRNLAISIAHTSVMYGGDSRANHKPDSAVVSGSVLPRPKCLANRNKPCMLTLNPISCFL
jgi:hypothetical protein